MTQLIKKLSEHNILLILGIVYTIVCTIVLLVPLGDLPKVDVDLPLDKVVHSIIHLFLALLWLLVLFTKSPDINPIKYAVSIFIACLVYGIIIELLQQTLTNSRQSDSWDVVANSIGALIGILLFWRIKHYFRT